MSMRSAPLFVALSLLLTCQASAVTVLISDDFNDNALNPAFWTVNNWTSTTPAFSAGNNVVEQNQRIEITAAAKLVTASQFAPGAQPEAGLQITGRVTFATNFEAFTLATRSDGQTEQPFGGVLNGISFRFDNANNMTIVGSGAAAGTITGLTNSGTLAKVTGEVYDFLIRDDGTNLTFTMNQVGGTKQKTVTAASAFAPATNFVTVHNRENNDGAHTLFLDNVTIASPTAIGPTLPAFRAVLSDNFNDNTLDPAKWKVNLTTNTQSPAGTTTFSESSGRANLQNRAYLSTVAMFDPIQSGGLQVAGQASITSADSRAVIGVRTDAVPNLSFFGAPLNGITFTLSNSGTGLLSAEQYVNGVASTLGSVAVAIATGELFDFVLTDNGTTLVMTINQVGGDGTTATLSVNSSVNFASDFILFTTREANSGTNKTAFFDNIVISTAAIPEPASLLLSLAGVGALALRRKQNRRA